LPVSTGCNPIVPHPLRRRGSILFGKEWDTLGENPGRGHSKRVSLEKECHSDDPDSYRERRNPFAPGVIPRIPIAIGRRGISSHTVSFRRSRWLSGEEESLVTKDLSLRYAPFEMTRRRSVIPRRHDEESLRTRCHSDDPDGYRERRNPLKQRISHSAALRSK